VYPALEYGTIITTQVQARALICSRHWGTKTWRGAGGIAPCTFPPWGPRVSALKKFGTFTCQTIHVCIFT